MSQEVATGYVTILPTTRGFAKNISSEMQGAFDESERQGSGVFNGLFKKVVGFAAGAAVAVGGYFSAKKIFGGGLDRLLNIEDAQAKLRGLGNDADAVSGIMANALAAVKGTSFGLGDAATAAAGAVAAGIKPGTELEGVLKSVANSAAAAGTGIDEMGSIYNKVASLGKAQNDVLQQVADRGIPIYQALAEQFGVTTDEVFKMASAGKIGFAEFQQAMTAASGTVAQELGTTVRGSLANLGSSLSRIGANLLGGIFPLFGPAIQGITSALGPVEDAAKRIGDAFGSWVTDAVMPGIRGLIDLVQGEFTPALREAFGWEEDSRAVDAILSIRAVTLGLVDTLRGVVAVIRDGDFNGELFAWLGVQEDSPLVDTLFRIRDAASQVVPTVSGAFAAMVAAYQAGGTDVTSSGLAGLFESIGLAARNYIDPMIPAFQSLWSAIQPIIPSVAEAAGVFSPLGLIFKALLPVLPQVAGLIGDLAATLVSALGPVIAAIVPVLSQVASILVGALSQAFVSLLPIITGLLPVVTSLVNILGGVLLTVIQAVAPLIVMLAGVIAQLLPVVMTLIEPLLGIVTALLPLVEIVGQLIGALLPPLVQLFSAILEPILALIAPLVGALAPILQLVGDLIGTLLVPVIGFLAEWLGKLIEFILPVTTAINALGIQAIAGLIQWLIQGVGKIAEFASTGVQRIREFADGAGQKIGEAIQFFRDLPSTISDVFSNAGEWLKESGQKIIQGLIDGIKNAAGGLVDAVGGVLSGARDLLPFSPAKKGPFSGKGWTLYSGRSIVQALAQGVLDERATLTAATASVLSGAQSQIDGVALSANVNGALAADAGNGGVSPVTQNIYPQPQQSEEEIGDAAARRLQWSFMGVPG